MNTKDAIRHSMNFNLFAAKSVLEDLSDEELLVRPVPGANHIAWQLGHLIQSEVQLLGMVPGVTPPELPAGFGKQHHKDNASSDQGYLKKAEYLALFDKVRASTLAALDTLSEADLDKPTPPDFKLVRTVGALFLLVADHPMMHVGQFTVVRRKLGKPVLF